MLGLPNQTEVLRVLPKESFYKKLEISSELKGKFVSDIKKITITNILSAKTLNVLNGTNVSEIIVLNIELKTREYDKRLIETIAKQNQHNLIFNMQYETENQQTIWNKKIYANDWKSKNDYLVSVDGLNLDDIWKSAVLSVAGVKTNAQVTLDEVLNNQEEINDLRKQIEILQKKVNNEKQVNRQFGMNTRLKEYRKKLIKLEEKL